MARPSLTTLLSQTLVAFIMEFDNEFERRMPHRTAADRGKAPLPNHPWLASMAMWSTCMRFVDDAGVSVGELEQLARTPTNLGGMVRWGYLTIQPDPAESRGKSPQNNWLIRPTEGGRRAAEVWRPLTGEIEQRWRLRFGGNAIDKLYASLAEIAKQLDPGLPDCLPIMLVGLFSRIPNLPPRTANGRDAADLPLPALLSRVLLAFALEFEEASDISLAMSSNILRVLTAEPVRIKDIPAASGVSKESISMALTFLKKRGLAVAEPDPAGSRGQVVRLTPRVACAKEECTARLQTIEKGWCPRFGAAAIDALRDSLQQLVGSGDSESSPLLQGLEPYPEGWRATVRRPSALPHYPMILHRGGYPDGS